MVTSELIIRVFFGGSILSYCHIIPLLPVPSVGQVMHTDRLPVLRASHNLQCARMLHSFIASPTGFGAQPLTSVYIYGGDVK